MCYKPRNRYNSHLLAPMQQAQAYIKCTSHLHHVHVKADLCTNICCMIQALLVFSTFQHTSAPKQETAITFKLLTPMQQVQAYIKCTSHLHHVHVKADLCTNICCMIQAFLGCSTFRHTSVPKQETAITPTCLRQCSKLAHMSTAHLIRSMYLSKLSCETAYTAGYKHFVAFNTFQAKQRNLG